LWKSQNTTEVRLQMFPSRSPPFQNKMLPRLQRVPVDVICGRERKIMLDKPVTKCNMQSVYR